MADAIPRREGMDVLRVVSSLSTDEVDVLVEVLKSAFKTIILDQVKTLNQSFKALDSKLNKLDPSSASKFNTFKASCGLIKDYHHGLSGRIGMVKKISSVKTVNLIPSHHQVLHTLNFLRRWRQNIAKSSEAISISRQAIITSLLLPKPNGTSLSRGQLVHQAIWRMEE